MVHSLKNKEIIKKYKVTGDSRYNYQNELDKTCFQHVMAYGDFKDLTRFNDTINSLQLFAEKLEFFNQYNQ